MSNFVRMSLTAAVAMIVFIQENMHAKYQDLLWTAPELLRMKQRPINGTQKGDVYSYSIVVQEISYRTQPYFWDDTYNVNPESRARLILFFSN